jgi:hypothetical protein
MRSKMGKSQKELQQVDAQSIYRKIGEAYYSIIASSASFKAGESNSPLKQLRIGCEHEFFLINKSNNPCSLEESQEFLSKLSELPSWRVFRPASTSQKYIYRVSQDLSDGNYHSVKYEHPPHLLEIALAPASSLLEFRDRIFHVWDDLIESCQRSNLNLFSSPFIAPPKVDWDAIALIDGQYLNLKRTREFLVSGSDILQPWVNFTTYTAATQFHIGGYQWWWQKPDLISKLYRTELVVGNKPYEKVPTGVSTRSEFFQRRWDGYARVFKSFPLVGFPNMSEWTIERWIKAFARSSLVVGEGDVLEGENLFSIVTKDPDTNLAAILSKVRDLQIIKPKLIGTLEFRADPALPTPEAITNQAALRFGAFLLCLKNHYEPFHALPFAELRERWWNGVNLSGLENTAENTIEHIWQSLRERGLGEEGLL